MKSGRGEKELIIGGESEERWDGEGWKIVVNSGYIVDMLRQGGWWGYRMEEVGKRRRVKGGRNGGEYRRR